MQSELIDIAGKIDRGTVSVFHDVAEVALNVGVPYVVIGATARDLVLHHYYGARIQRATEDLDFAVQVPDWAAFHVMVDGLLERGFVSDSQQQQRLRSASGNIIDVVPFGPVAAEDEQIVWPPKNEIVMSVLGMQEAFDSAITVRLQKEPQIDIPVATPMGLMVLKLIAWTDRAPAKRKKDAMDVFFLLSSYEEIPVVQEEFYDDMELIEAYDGDRALGGAQVLGRHVDNILQEATRRVIDQILADDIPGLSRETLLVESCGTNDSSQFDRHSAFLDAFAAGLNGSVK